VKNTVPVGRRGFDLLDDDLGHRRQETVYEVGQTFRVELLRQAREPADVAEHDRHGPRLTAEVESFGVGGELVDIVRRHVLRERSTDLTLPRLSAQMAAMNREVNSHRW